jgi:predicted Zn-dependent protease
MKQELDPFLGVLVAPVPLVAGRLHDHVGFRNRLLLEQDRKRERPDEDQDQGRHDRPRHLDLGADDGELFLERRRSEALVFDDGRVKNASYDASEGFGLRAVRGEVAGYAHSAPTSRRPRSSARLKPRASRWAMAAAPGGRPPARTNRKALHRRRPDAGCAFPVKLDTLREIDAFARALDPRVVQVSASMAASHQEVVILRPDGHARRATSAP